MKRLSAQHAFAAVLLLALTAAGALTVSAQEDGAEPASPIILENKHVMMMVRAKIAPEVILEKIRISSCNFDTFPPLLAELKSKGVPDSVLLAMVKAPHGVSAAEADARGPVVYHPVDEVLKYTAAYSRTGSAVTPSRAARPSTRRSAPAPIRRRG
ncbi:MAG TPA: hypothetical protein VF240_22360 [Pyrinomonadaceae bacterium]